MQPGSVVFQRYTHFMLRTLPKRACHVVFGTTTTLGAHWDIIATVRYRSRRDLAELFVSEDFATVVVHKWAALEDNLRIPVQSRGFFSTAYLPIAALLLVVVSVVAAIERLVRRARRIP